jgi:hypothetical protein
MVVLNDPTSQVRKLSHDRSRDPEQRGRIGKPLIH